jgi:hypothetical protein
MIYILLLLYFIPLVLSIDLSYWDLQQTYVHWKKEQNFDKSILELEKRILFKEEYTIRYSILLSFIPVINILAYIFVIIFLMQNHYKYSLSYSLMDIVGWKKGLNAFIWKLWRPSIQWRTKYPIL